jgi:hypothetical protein
MLLTFHINNLLTDVSSCIDKIASARTFATLKHLIFDDPQATPSGIVLVTTSCSIGDASIR